MYLVFDIGGSKIRAGYSEDGLTFLRTETVPTPQQYSKGLEVIVGVGKAISAGKIASAAIGVPGIVINDQLSGARNLPDWNGKPLSTDFKYAFGVAPLLRNDSEMGGLGELIFGAGKYYSSILYLTIGTGVGGSIIKRGNPSISENIEPGRIIMDDGADLERLIKQGGSKDADTARGIAKILAEHSVDAVIIGGGMVLNNYVSVDSIKQELADSGLTIPVIRGTMGDEVGLYGALSLLK